MKTYQKEIDATHPMEDSAGKAELDADMLAMKLVGERYEKRDLVNLVRWLILRKPQGLLPFPVVQSDDEGVALDDQREKLAKNLTVKNGRIVPKS